MGDRNASSLDSSTSGAHVLKQKTSKELLTITGDGSRKAIIQSLIRKKGKPGKSTKLHTHKIEVSVMSASRKCFNSPDSFCYICGSFTVPSQRTNISNFLKKVYLAYFDVRLGDQDKSWAPHKVCKPCVENLRQWSKGKRKKIAFGIPMIWREPKNHVDDCYFCLVQTSGYNKKNKQKITYPSLESAIRPVPHSDEIPVPLYKGLPSLEDEEDMADVVEHESDMDFEDDGSFSNSRLQCLNQAKLNDLMTRSPLFQQLDEFLPKLKQSTSEILEKTEEQRQEMDIENIEGCSKVVEMNVLLAQMEHESDADDSEESDVTLPNLKLPKGNAQSGNSKGKTGKRLIAEIGGDEDDLGSNHSPASEESR